MPKLLRFIDEPRIDTKGIVATHVTVKSETDEYASDTGDVPDEHKIERLVKIDDGDQDTCKDVADELLSRWGREQLSIIGRVDLNVKLSFKEYVKVEIPTAGIDGLYILQRKEHDLASYVTEVTVGDIILSESELLSRIIENLEK